MSVRRGSRGVPRGGLGPGDEERAVREVGVRVALHAAAGRPGLRPGAEQHRRRRERLPGVAQRAERRDGERPARRVAGEREPGGRRLGEERSRCGEAVVLLGGEAMLGREPVVHRDDARVRAEGDAGEEVAVGVRRAQHVAPAVEVEDRALRRAGARRAGEPRHAAEADGLEGDLGRVRDAHRERGLGFAQPRDALALRAHHRGAHERRRELGAKAPARAPRAAQGAPRERRGGGAGAPRGEIGEAEGTHAGSLAPPPRPARRATLARADVPPPRREPEPPHPARHLGADRA